jgi:hypothetical protein
MPMTSTERSQRLRERRKKAGGKQVALWLPSPLLQRTEVIAKESGQPLSTVLVSAIDIGAGYAQEQLIQKLPSDSTE